MLGATTASAVSAQESADAKPQKYRVVVLPVDGGADSYLAGYLLYAPLNALGTLGVAGDETANPAAYNPYTWTDGHQTDLETLPSIPRWSSSGANINWINQWGLSAGYATRTDAAKKTSVDSAVIWTPDGSIIDLLGSTETASHVVWVNDIGQVAGWTASTTADACAFGTSFAHTQAFLWEFGVFCKLGKLGTLGGTDSYGEFINDLG